MTGQKACISMRAGRGLRWGTGVSIALLVMAASAWAGGPSPDHMGHLMAPLAAAGGPAAASETRPMAAAQAVPASAVRIEIRDYKYLPATLTVPAGTTVVWSSHDDDPHTVTESDKVFTSPGLDADETFSYTFTKPGTYTYHCTLHPEMTGTIVVK